MRRALLLLLFIAAGCRRERPAEYSGTVETREIQVGSKIGGRVTTVLVEEGQTVKTGAPLIRFEAEELKAQREQAEARVSQAEAELARLERGFRPEEIQQAEAAARQQQALLEAAKRGPREQELRQSHAEYAAAKAEATNAEIEYQRIAALFANGDVAAQRRDDALARRDLTASKAEAARQRLALLEAGTREEELRAAEQRYRQAQAQAQLTRRGSRAEDIAAARARLREARGRVAELRTRIEESELRAPADSRVEVVSVRPGDLVVPNRTVVTLLEPSQLWVRVYVPETQLGRVKIGQKAAVKIDTFTGRKFDGTVEQIASQGEFLPRNVQTRDDREHQVFGVKIRVANPDGVLKSGMAATVTLG
ncbi:MAG TPA: efflux RND transporter periplasmic adaptor subunit [Bryobacteraceae bacterium]|nr:efflux RND transporter periplasmic adaptor subunit [Bryobacteraceae bacterium]